MGPETLVRRSVDAYNSGQLEAQIELFDPDIELGPHALADLGLCPEAHSP